MKQFDVYVNTDKGTNKTYPYFINIQTGLLDTLNSRVVIPLTPAGTSDKSFPNNLCPVIKIKHKDYAVLTHQITSVSASFLKIHECSITSYRDEIITAIDFLVTGI